MQYEFKTHVIVKNCDKKYKDYHQYDKYLETDFKNRCCYCNLHDALIKPLPFQTDHFIPITVFQGKRDELLTDYNNLMYACPKCNRLKSGKFAGDLPTEGVVNPLFYNPVDVDYNTVFYRDDKGNILSKDKLGKQMIETLKLYRPIHQVAWFLDELEKAYADIENRLKTETDFDKKKNLQQAYEKLGNVLLKKERVFRNSY